MSKTKGSSGLEAASTSREMQLQCNSSVIWRSGERTGGQFRGFDWSCEVTTSSTGSVGGFRACYATDALKGYTWARKDEGGPEDSVQARLKTDFRRVLVPVGGDSCPVDMSENADKISLGLPNYLWWEEHQDDRERGTRGFDAGRPSPAPSTNHRHMAGFQECVEARCGG